MTKLIEESHNWKLYKCNSLFEAKEILSENNIQFDCIYEIKEMIKHYITGEMRETTKNSIHYYINNGISTNVAYYTPIMGTLAIIERRDDTPENKRKYINIVNC